MMKFILTFSLLTWLCFTQTQAQCTLEWHEGTYAVQWVPQEKIFRFFKATSEDSLKMECQAPFSKYNPGDTVVWRMWPGLHSRLLAVSWNPAKKEKNKTVALAVIEITDFKLRAVASARTKIPGNAIFLRMSEDVVDFYVPGNNQNLCMNIINPKKEKVHVFFADYDHFPADTLFYEHKTTSCGNVIYNPFSKTELYRLEKLAEFRQDSLLSPVLALKRQQLQNEQNRGENYALKEFVYHTTKPLKIYDSNEGIISHTSTKSPTCYLQEFYCQKEDFNEDKMQIIVGFMNSEIQDTAVIWASKFLDENRIVGYRIQYMSNELLYVKFYEPSLFGKPIFMSTGENKISQSENDSETILLDKMFQKNQDLYSMLTSKDPYEALNFWLGTKCVQNHSFCAEKEITAFLRQGLERMGYQLDLEKTGFYNGDAQLFEIATNKSTIYIFLIDSQGIPQLFYRPKDDYNVYNWAEKNPKKIHPNTGYMAFGYASKFNTFTRYEVLIKQGEASGYYHLLCFSK